MADLAFNALPAGSGNMLSTDRIPVDKYNGGPYITVYRTGQEIMNSITSLATATFTNINTSINNVQANIVPTVNTEYFILETRYTGSLFTSGTSVILTVTNVNTNMILNSPYIINVKLYGKCVGSTIATKIKEVNIAYVNKAVPEIIGTYPMYEYADANGSNITIANPIVHSTNNLQITTSHTISGENVTVKAKLTIYKS